MVGARAVVTRPVPTGCVAAGIPARIVRRGITWSHADTPPDVSGPHFVTGRSRFAKLAAAVRGIRAGTLLAALRRS